MAIHVYKAGRTHIVDDLDCTIVTVSNVDEMQALIDRGDHYHTVQEIHFPAEKPEKKTRKKAEKPAEVVEEVVESAESEPVADTDENENTAD